MKRIGLVLILLAVLSSTSAAVTISIGNGSAQSSETVVVPLMINNVTGAGSVEVNLTYDPSIVIPVNIIDSDFDLPPQDPPINTHVGYVIINAMQFATELDGNVSLGNITLKAIGNKESSSILCIKDVILQDMAMTDIPVDSVINGTFTITSTDITPSNGGSSGGSGSSGGDTSGEAFENIICTETDREYVNKGSAISYRFNLECNNIGYINFTALSSSGNIAAKVEILNDTSSLVNKTPPGIVFRNLNIWVGNYGGATEKNMQDVVIGFKVDRSWVSQNNIDESSITMYRFNEGQWVPLNTIKNSEDANHLFLEAQTPGFSPFAITGSSYSKASADDQITGTETGNAGQTSALEDTRGSVKWNTLIPGILVAFFALLYGIILLLSQKIRTKVLFCRDDLKDPETVDDMNKLIEGPILRDGRFREVPLTEEANILLERKPEGDDRIRFNRLLLESAYPQEIITKLHERFDQVHWIMLLVIFIPLVGFIDMVGSPLNWVIGILLECVIVIYLVLKVKKYSLTSRFI